MAAALREVREPWWRRRVGVRVGTLAASLLVTALLIGASWMARPSHEDAPRARASLTPPRPDRVLYFERGVDWKETGS
jgi:hypothetical protein